MILNIYKPKNWTSFDVVAKIRGILKEKKVGHAGTLDPLAEGVLVVLTDKDTKKQNEFMQFEKEYIAEVAFGAHSPTYDLEGELAFSERQISKEELEKKLPSVTRQFIGEIDQTAPAFSAKKVDGKRLYKMARKGTLGETKLPVKKVLIKDIEILDVFDREFVIADKKVSLPVAKIRVTCGSGTYIRSLAHDLGEKLDTGAVLAYLQRTRVGEYTVENSQKIEEIEKQFKA